MGRELTIQKLLPSTVIEQADIKTVDISIIISTQKVAGVSGIIPKDVENNKTKLGYIARTKNMIGVRITPKPALRK